MGGTVFTGISQENAVYALDSETGDVQWQFQTNDVVHSSPTIVNEMVFIGSDDGNVYAIDATTGSEQWQFATGDEVHSSPIVVDGTLFIGSMDRDPIGGAVYAVDAGVSRSSEGSRVNSGTLGHHNVWADGIRSFSVQSGEAEADGNPDTDEESPGFSLFEQFGDSSSAPLGLVAGGLLAGSLGAYWWRNRNSGGANEDAE